MKLARVAARCARYDDLVARFQRRARHPLLAELARAAPFDRPSLHHSVLVRHPDMKLRMGIQPSAEQGQRLSR